MWKEKIKFEDYRTALQYIEKQGYMFSFNLKSGYHHIDIHSSQFEFLGFSWNFKGKTRYYVFTVLPFGISSDPYIFTKVMRVLVKYWRLQGICFSKAISTSCWFDYLNVSWKWQYNWYKN